MAIETKPIPLRITMEVRDKLDVIIVMKLLEALSTKFLIIIHPPTHQYPPLLTYLFPSVIVIVIDMLCYRYYCSITITKVVAIYLCCYSRCREGER